MGLGLKISRCNCSIDFFHEKIFAKLKPITLKYLKIPRLYLVKYTIMYKVFSKLSENDNYRIYWLETKNCLEIIHIDPVMILLFSKNFQVASQIWEKFYQFLHMFCEKHLRNLGWNWDGKKSSQNCGYNCLFWSESQCTLIDFSSKTCRTLINLIFVSDTKEVRCNMIPFKAAFQNDITEE